MSRPEAGFTRLIGTYLRETEKAVQFKVTEVGTKVLDDSVTTWFPFSQIKSSTRTPREGEDMIEVADWILISKELI